jgi:hypothetical protein
MRKRLRRDLGAENTIHDLRSEVGKLRLEEYRITFVSPLGKVDCIDFLKLLCTT